jgi:AraC-like DNA-binding protein
MRAHRASSIARTSAVHARHDMRRAEVHAGPLPGPGVSLRTVTSVVQNQKLYGVSKIAVLVESLRREGVAPSKALQGVGLNERELHRADTRVSVNQIMGICRNALSLSRDPHFAYRAGMGIHLSTYGMYGFAILSSTTFRQGIAFALKYHQLAIPLVDLSWSEEGGRGTWSLIPIEGLHLADALWNFVVELELAIVLSLHRDYIGRAFSPLQVRLPFPAPPDARVYPDMFGCPVVFGQAQAGLILDSKWLAGEPQFGNEIAHLELVRLCDELLEEFRLRVGIAGRVREILLVNRMSMIRAAEVAKQLHMTERTLRRRLRAEKTSFRKVLAELRMRVAMKYLRDTGLSVGEIAHSLGFSEDSSFRQAFRRWSKVPPRSFRAHPRRPARAL